MEEKNKDNKLYNMGCPCPVPSRPSLFQTVEYVKKQVGYKDFGKKAISGNIYIEPIYNEICLIIAEVYITPPERLIRIRGTLMDAAVVQEVYKALSHDHVALVVEKFKEQTGLIKKKTAYLQTALYNVLFEIESHYTNAVKHDLYGAD